jgi:hypothetical protein
MLDADLEPAYTSTHPVVSKKSESRSVAAISFARAKRRNNLAVPGKFRRL